MTTLTTDRLTLRVPTLDDFDPLAAFYASDRSRFVGGPQTAELTWRTLATEVGHWHLRGYGRFAVEERSSGKLCGIIGPFYPLGFPEPELGWDLMNGFEGKGYATEAARAVRDYVYGTLGMTTLISLIAHGNTGSEAVARRLGCVEEPEVFTHERWGELRVFRHPSPGELA